VRVLFNVFHYDPPSGFTITVNGHTYQKPWPYPDQVSLTWRTVAQTINLTDLVPGTNLVTIGSDQAQIVSNVNIVLVNVGGAPAPPPPPPPPSAPTNLHAVIAVLAGGLLPMTPQQLWQSSLAR